MSIGKSTVRVEGDRATRMHSKINQMNSHKEKHQSIAERKADQAVPRLHPLQGCRLGRFLFSSGCAIDVARCYQHHIQDSPVHSALVSQRAPWFGKITSRWPIGLKASKFQD